MSKENLMPIEEVNSNRTREQHSADSRKGGIASGEARRAKKGMQNIAKWILEMPLNNGETAEDIQNFAQFAGQNITVEQAIMIKQLQKALKGDIQSATFIRDTSGQKPKEVIEHQGEISNPYSNLTEEELRKLAQDESSS